MNYNKVRLSEICTIEKGTTGITKAIEGIYPMVTMAEARTSHNEYQFDTKAVIIPLVSSSGHGHASMKRIHYQEGKFAIGSILCAVIPKNEAEVNARFLYNYLHFQRESILVPLMRGAANVSLSIKSVSSVEINLPSINEQIAINQLVDGFKEKNETLQTENQTQAKLLTKLRKAYLQEAVMGQLTADWREQNPTQDTGKTLLTEIKKYKAQLIKEGKLRKEKPLNLIKPEEIPFEIPGNWTWCRLGEVCEISMGQSPDGTSYNEKGIGVPLINGPVEFGGMGAFDRTVKRKFTTEPTKMCQKGDLLICVRGSTTGRTNIADFDACIGRGVASIRPFLFDKYIFYFVIHARNSIFDLGRGSTFPNVSQDQILKIPVPLPPLTEQQAIVSKIEGLLAQVEGLEKENKAQQQYAQRLMGAVLQEAFGG